MKKLLEHIILEQEQLTELDWRKAAGGIALAGALVTGSPSHADAMAKPITSIQKAFSGDLVAKVIAGEAAGEGEIGMQAVANVIYNRMKKQHKTAEQIVSAPHQFSAISDPGLMARNYKAVKPIADNLVFKIQSLPDITNGATHYVTTAYYNKHKHSEWLSRLRIIKVIGNHTFLK